MDKVNRITKRPKSAEPSNTKTKIFRKLQAKKSHNNCYEVEIYRNRCLSAELYRKDELESSDGEFVNNNKTDITLTNSCDAFRPWNRNCDYKSRNTDYYGRPLFSNFIFPDDDSIRNDGNNEQNERRPLEPKIEDIITQNNEIYEQFKRSTKIPSRLVTTKENHVIDKQLQYPNTTDVNQVKLCAKTCSDELELSALQSQGSCKTESVIDEIDDCSHSNNDLHSNVLQMNNTTCNYNHSTSNKFKTSSNLSDQIHRGNSPSNTDDERPISTFSNQESIIKEHLQTDQSINLDPHSNQLPEVKSENAQGKIKPPYFDEKLCTQDTHLNSENLIEYEDGHVIATNEQLCKNDSNITRIAIVADRTNCIDAEANQTPNNESDINFIHNEHGVETTCLYTKKTENNQDVDKDKKGTAIQNDKNGTTMKTDTIDLFKTEMTKENENKEEKQTHQKQTNFTKNNKMQERKSRSRFRNILARRRNCVSPSTVTHVASYKRSRSCPPINTCAKCSSNCTSSVCCINSVEPIAYEDKNCTNFDNLEQIKQNYELSYKSKKKRNTVSPSIGRNNKSELSKTSEAETIRIVSIEECESNESRSQTSFVDGQIRYRSKSVPPAFGKKHIKADRLEQAEVSLPGQLSASSTEEEIDDEVYSNKKYDTKVINQQRQDFSENETDLVNETVKRDPIHVCGACATKLENKEQNQEHNKCIVTIVTTECSSCNTTEAIEGKKTKANFNENNHKTSTHNGQNIDDLNTEILVNKAGSAKDKKKRVSNFRAILPFDDERINNLGKLNTSDNVSFKEICNSGIKRTYKHQDDCISENNSEEQTIVSHSDSTSQIDYISNQSHENVIQIPVESSSSDIQSTCMETDAQNSSIIDDERLNVSITHNSAKLRDLAARTSETQCSPRIFYAMIENPEAQKVLTRENSCIELPEKQKPSETGIGRVGKLETPNTSKIEGDRIGKPETQNSAAITKERNRRSDTISSTADKDKTRIPASSKTVDKDTTRTPASSTTVDKDTTSMLEDDSMNINIHHVSNTSNSSISEYVQGDRQLFNRLNDSGNENCTSKDTHDRNRWNGKKSDSSSETVHTEHNSDTNLCKDGIGPSPGEIEDGCATESEVKKLGKKCRSISSAHQERRRLGTPLTLILYVKKKCQAKIKKILTTKNNTSFSSQNHQTVENEESVNDTTENLPTLTYCDNNGNNIYRRPYSRERNQYHDEETISELRNVLKNGSRPLTEEEMVRLESFSRLDPSTLKVLGWSSGASESLGNTPDISEQDDETMCRISRGEFKRLQEQVRDVSFNLRNRFRTSAYQQANLVPGKKLYQQPNPTPLENTTQLYRTQLAASLRAFKPKEWPPLNSQDIETSYLRCKPINCQNDSHSSSPAKCCSTKTRPKSVPPSAFRNRNQQRRPDTPTDVRPGNFDSLNPRILSHLLSDTLTTSSCAGLPKNQQEHDGRNEGRIHDAKDDDISTSGIDSTPTDDTSDDDDDDSDYEPEVDENRLAPELYLRPEKLDSLVLPDSAKGWRKFDFDADNVNIPVYTFANPLPDPFHDLDLRQVARLKWNWRDQTRQRTREKYVDDILDRMVELERLQMETEDWEQKRSAQINKRYSKRVTSAKNPRDKRCCSKCLQPACTGDCPEKFVQSEICELCRQPFCVKTCNDTRYDQRMRQSRVDDKSPVPRSVNPKYCKSCQSKHNAKIINANNIVLGRPKSCNSTYSRGQASNKPKDYRPRAETPVSAEMFQEFDKLGIDAQQPSRPTTAKIQRPRSRNSSFPSKSFYSQRRDSLTEADKNRFKKKQPKNKVLVRRPKTAV